MVLKFLNDRVNLAFHTHIYQATHLLYDIMIREDIFHFIYSYMTFIISMLAMLVTINICDNKILTFAICTVIWAFLFWYLWARDTYGKE